MSISWSTSDFGSTHVTPTTGEVQVGPYLKIGDGLYFQPLIHDWLRINVSMTFHGAPTGNNYYGFWIQVLWFDVGGCRDTFNSHEVTFELNSVLNHSTASLNVLYPVPNVPSYTFSYVKIKCCLARKYGSDPSFDYLHAATAPTPFHIVVTKDVNYTGSQCPQELLNEAQEEFIVV